MVGIFCKITDLRTGRKMKTDNPFVQAHRYTLPDKDGHLDESLVEYGVDMLLECFSDEFTESDYQQMYENLMNSPEVRLNTINEWNDGGWYDISPFEWMNKFSLGGIFGKLFAPIKWLFALALGGLLLALAGIAALLKKGLHELALKRLENYLNRLVVLADTGWKKKKHKSCLVNIKDGYRKDCLIYAGKLLKGAGLMTGEERAFPQQGQAQEGYFAGHVFLPNSEGIDIELLKPVNEYKWFGLKKVSKDPWEDIKNTTDYTKGILNEGWFNFGRNRNTEEEEPQQQEGQEDNRNQQQGQAFEADPHRFVTSFGAFFGYALTEIFGDNVASAVKNSISQSMRGESMAALVAGEYENRTGKEDISNIRNAPKYGAGVMQNPPSRNMSAYESAEIRYQQMRQRLFEDNSDDAINRERAEREILSTLFPGTSSQTIISVILKNKGEQGKPDWSGCLVKEAEGTYSLDFITKVMGNSIPFTTVSKFCQFLKDNGIQCNDPSDPNVAGQIVNILKRNKQDAMATVFNNEFRTASRRVIKANDQEEAMDGKRHGAMAEAQNIGQAFMVSMSQTPYTNFAMYMKMKQDMDAFLNHLNTAVLNIINRVAKVVYDRAQAGNGNAVALYQFIVGKGDPKANNKLTYMWNATCMRKLREQVTIRCNELFASAEFKYLLEVCLISMSEVLEFATTGHVSQFTETDLHKIEAGLGNPQGTSSDSGDEGTVPPEESPNTDEADDGQAYNPDGDELPHGPNKAYRFLGDLPGNGRIPNAEFYKNINAKDRLDIRIYDKAPDYAFFNVISTGLIPEEKQSLLDDFNNGKQMSGWNGYAVTYSVKPPSGYTEIRFNNSGWGRMHKEGNEWVMDFPCLVDAI